MFVGVLIGIVRNVKACDIRDVRYGGVAFVVKGLSKWNSLVAKTNDVGPCTVSSKASDKRPKSSHDQPLSWVNCSLAAWWM